MVKILKIRFVPQKIEIFFCVRFMCNCPLNKKIPNKQFNNTFLATQQKALSNNTISKNVTIIFTWKINIITIITFKWLKKKKKNCLIQTNKKKCR